MLLQLEMQIIMSIVEYPALFIVAGIAEPAACINCSGFTPRLLGEVCIIVWYQTREMLDILRKIKSIK